MNYTIHQLQIFLKVIQTRSITKASEELFMTQPAVSIQLKKFQDQFDIPLTEVIGRQLYVTDFGIEIGKIAEKVIQELENINYKTQAYEGLLTGRLNISSASTGKYVIPYFLSGFLEKNTGIDLVLDVTNKSRVIESLKNNETDFALVSVLPDKLDIEEELLIENKLYLFGNESRRRKDKALIYREEGSATRMAMEQYFDKHEGQQRKRMELTSNEAVKQAVIAGLGYSIMPLIGMKNELLNNELHLLPSRGLPIKTEWRLIWLKGKKMSPVSEYYLEFIRTEKQKIREEYFDWYLKY
ncbi:LysR family transcriptional regulator [Fulvivirga sedimenti]|uniref:LysR family transcriptional regulator n=1 Tax=Fulvivirga sedimenti TaxID=2879465 RepID=A0A9X1HQQ9_9BACT|nr:LysR family transcriptional regulator [Fulvivirga sedimenti]MCA6075038.1 LysR family transcriptional regulator [Fulvivirga sedimenti]MCA6076215.1 LysR family transcriptional regulator [Fulvivirga sedimenti]MCA6077343.1 LysR family transcriptional regulator [Fulvivirga sedimenti]